MPITLNTTINQVAFTHELSRLDIAGATSSVTVALRRNGLKRFEATYTPDSAGCVTVYDVDRLIEADLDSGGVATPADYGININNASTDAATVKVFRCSVMTDVPASVFLQNRFLTVCNKVRDTQIDRTEWLWLYSSAAIEAVVDCVFVDRSGELSESSVTVNVPQGLQKLDVSPRKFAGSPLGPALVAYTVTAGARKMTFRLRDLKKGVGMLFVNAFGCVEPIWLHGTVETKPDIKRSTVISHGSLMCYNIDETVSHKVWSGPLGADDCALGCDLARSKQVWLLEANGNTRPVIITESDTPHSDAVDELFEFSFTYQSADRRTAMAATLPAYLGIFDENYNESFN